MKMHEWERDGVSAMNVLKRLAYGPLSSVFSLAYRVVSAGEYVYFSIRWRLEGAKRPTEQEAELVRENVTFIYKSFERQKLAKRLYRNIQRYYPGVKVIVADDSRTPLDLHDKHIEVIQLPFNSGLSFGLNRALEKVNTPYVIRMDDDQLLTPHTRFHDQLRFLQTHPMVDLVGVLQFSTPRCERPAQAAKEFYNQPMNGAALPLKIPHMSCIDGRVVVGKGSNVFITHTDKLKMIGYDDHVRMIDHHDFFYRSAGRLVSVIDPQAFVFHNHNRFNAHYRRFRSDVDGDRRYIAQRNYFEMMKYRAELRKQHEENITPDSGRDKQ